MNIRGPLKIGWKEAPCGYVRDNDVLVMEFADLRLWRQWTFWAISGFAISAVVSGARGIG